MDGTQNISGNTAAQHKAPLDDRSRQRLQRVTKEFESLLVGYMLKSMRSGTQTNELFGESYGGDAFESLFDSQMAEHVSRNSSLGLAEMLYRRMTGEEMPRSHAGNHAHTAQSAQVQRDHPPAVAAPPATTASAPAAVHKEVPPAILSRDDKKDVSAVPPDTTRAVPDTLQRRLDKVAPFITEAADTNRVDPNLLKAIIAAESHGDAQARSPKNAKGLMQLIDSTAAAMGVKNVWNPRDNVQGGAKYLSQLLDKFGGDLEKAIASYNAGPGAVQRHGGVPPFKETRAYVEKVMGYLRTFEQQESENGNDD
jgi:Rod binding domain-containing protein